MILFFRRLVRHPIKLAFVLLLTLLLLPFSAPSSPVQAASVASSSADGFSTDKQRCNLNHSGAAPTTSSQVNIGTVRLRCFYDDSRAWSFAEGLDYTDLSNTPGDYRYVTKAGPNCSSTDTGTLHVGPQTAGQSPSGTAIPRYAYEYTGTYTCQVAGFGGTSTGATRFRYVSGNQNEQASGTQTVAQSSSWPNYPANWYPGGSPAVPPSDCEALTPTLTLNGTSVTPGTVAVDTYTVSPSDTVRTSVTYATGLSFSTVYRYGPASPFRATTLYSSTPAGGGLLKTDLITVKPYDVAALNKLELKCTGPDNVAAYYSYDTGAWSVSPSLNRACASLVISLPEGTFDEGDSIKVGYTLDSPPLGGFVNADVWVNVFMSIPRQDPQPSVTTRSILGTVVGGPAPFVGHVPVGTSGSITFGAMLANSGFDDFANRPLDTIKIGCNDSLGSYSVQGTGPPVTFTAYVGNAPSEDCYNGSGMSLQPSTWLRGFARMGSCLTQELTVPDPENFGEELRGMIETVEDKPPFVVIAVVVDFTQSLVDSYESSSGTGCFDGPTIPGVTADPEVCIGDGVPVSTPQRNIIAMLLVVPMVFGMASQILALVRSRAEILEDENGQTSWHF